MNKYLLIDVSRGRVFKKEFFELILPQLKKYNFQGVKLYIEDIITLEEYPMFGYNRGKYSDQEIIEIKELLKNEGITLLPCIQGLGHMENFLSHQSSACFAETSLVLNGEEVTMQFLKTLISKVAFLFGTEFVNIGFDETNDLGFGKNFKENRTVDQKQLFLEQLKKVIQICKDNEFQRIEIWADMLTYLHSSEFELYTSVDKISDEFIETIPTDLELNFWNYWTSNEKEYAKMLNIFIDTKRKVNVSTGIHSWTAPIYDYSFYDSIKIHEKVCMENNINDLTYTMWFDDGAICELDSLVRAFDYIFGNEVVSDYNYIRSSCFGINLMALLWDDIINLNYLNSIDDVKKIEKLYNFTFEIDVENMTLLQKTFIKIVSLKLSYYLQAKENKREVNETLMLLKNNLFQYLKLLEDQWNIYCKSYGMDRFQYRLSGQIYRIDYLITNKIEPNFAKREETLPYFERVAYSNFNRFK